MPYRSAKRYFYLTAVSSTKHIDYKLPYESADYKLMPYILAKYTKV